MGLDRDDDDLLAHPPKNAHATTAIVAAMATNTMATSRVERREGRKGLKPIEVPGTRYSAPGVAQGSGLVAQSRTSGGGGAGTLSIMWFTTEDRDQIRWIRLDRPDRKNAIPADGWDQLRSAFEAFERSDARVLVILGNGGEFCAGADLDPSAAADMAGVISRSERMKTVGAAALALHRLTKPSIAAVDGVAVGAGMNLALGCDVVIASTRARFSEIFVRRGLTLDFGGSWLLPRIIGQQRAKELALSGRMVGAEEALAIGLVLEVVEPDQLEAVARQRAESFLDGAPVAQMFVKQAIDRSWDVTFEEALAWEGQSQAICFGTEDVGEGIAAFLQKRPPRFTGR